VRAGRFPLPSLDRLPSGRHRLSREAVENSQRGRLLFAVAQVVAERGYGATTVGDIVELANVSRTTFYEQFDDKEACFLAAFDFGVEFVLGQMRAAWEALPDGRDWRAHVRSDLKTFLETLAAEPAFALALQVEVLAAGPAALDRRAEVFALFTERTRRLNEIARAQEPGMPELPDELFQIHTGGADEVIRQHLRTEGAERLPELVDPLAAATIALFGDREWAPESERELIRDTPVA
jgi:AcrR family transcriptional regulator